MEIILDHLVTSLWRESTMSCLLLPLQQLYRCLFPKKEEPEEDPCPLPVVPLRVNMTEFYEHFINLELDRLFHPVGKTIHPKHLPFRNRKDDLRTLLLVKRTRQQEII